MRIEDEYRRGFKFGIQVGFAIAVVIMALMLLLTSCAPYPLQQKVIKPSNAKASFR